MSEPKKLFPPHLNKGSRGRAVLALQMWLQGSGYQPGRLIPDGDYGEVTAQAVAELQSDAGIEQDGNFGPATREAIKNDQIFGIDFDSIPDITEETVAIGP